MTASYTPGGSFDVLAVLIPQPVATTAVAPVANTLQPYNASSGPLAPVLPPLSGTRDNANLAVEKDGADTSPYAVTLTCSGTDTFANGATTIPLLAAGERVHVQAATISGTRVWKIMAPAVPRATTDTRYSLSVPALENAPAIGFGHSFLASKSDLSPGPGADVDGHALERVAVRCRTKAVSTYSSQTNIANYAQGGTRSDQILASIQTNYSPNQRGVIMLGGGHRNDQNFYGNSTPKTGTVAEVFRSIFALLTSQLAQSYTSISFGIASGTWTSGSAGTGAVMNFAFNGDSAFIAYAAVTGSGGTFTVKDASNNVLKTVTTGGFGTAFTGVTKISGLGAGTHQVTINVTAGTVGIVGSRIPAATPPLIVWQLEASYNPNVVSGGALANTVNTAYQTATRAVLTDFDQTRIVVVDAPPTWDPTIDTYPDGVHPNGQGHAKIADWAMLKLVGTTFRQGLNYLTGSSADPTGYSPPTATGSSTGTPFVTDTFTDTTGTLLTAHTGETGATWVRSGSAASCNGAVTAAGRLRNNVAFTTLMWASGTPGSADYAVQADFYFASLLAGSSSGICLRGSSTEANANNYILRYVVNSAVWRIDKTVAGAATTIATYTPGTAPAAGETHTAKLTASGSTLTALVDGVQIMQVTDTSLTAAGFVNVSFTSVNHTDTTGIHLDNLSAA